MKLAAKIHTLMCDDVRREIGNKVSLMGVYGNDIAVDSFPTVLPQLLLVVFLFHPKIPMTEGRFKLSLPKKFVLEGTISPPPDHPIKRINMVIGAGPVALASKGKGKWELFFGDSDKPQIVHRFNITQKHGVTVRI